LIRFTRLLWLGVGVALVLLPALPIPAWVGAKDQGPVWAPNVAAWAIGLLVVVTGGLLAGRMATKLESRKGARLRIPPLAIVGALALTLTAAALYVMWGVFAGNPHLVDEIAQLFHARTFAAGRLAAPVPEPAEAFLLMNTLVAGDAWMSQYPPGQTVLLAVGLLLRAEWLVNPLLGGIGTILIYLMGRGLYGPKTGMVAAFLWAASAWVMFMSGTYISHVGATILALASWTAVFAPKHPGRWHFLAAGLALAAAGATRPLDGVAALAPLLGWMVIRKRWRSLGWIALGGAPILLLVGYMNWQLFGNPFTLGFTALYGDAVGLGFHTDPWGDPFNLSVALSNLAVGIRRLHVYLYEWPIPALLPLAVWALLDRHRHPSDLIVALGVIAAPFLYFFYWHSGFFLGPRFFFASVPFLVLGTARAWRWGMSNARRRSTAFVRLDAATAFAAFAVIVWGWIGILPARIDVYRTRWSSFQLHPERELRAAGVDRALVIIPESWGSRMVTALWAMGAPVGLVEQAYRSVDHCDLDGFVRDMRRAALTGEQVTEQLRLMVAGITAATPRVAGAPDPTLRLRPRERLPDRCRIELDRDLRGFALYSTVGWRNEIGLSSGIVFARDLYERNGALLDRYPGWAVWRYAPPEDRPNASPVLTQLREEGSFPAAGTEEVRSDTTAPLAAPVRR